MPNRPDWVKEKREVRRMLGLPAIEGRNWIRKWQVKSSRGPKLYVVALDDKGDWGCSCPGWIYHRTHCKHIRQIVRERGE